MNEYAIQILEVYCVLTVSDIHHLSVFWDPYSNKNYFLSDSFII